MRIRLGHIRNCNPTPLPTPGVILKLQTPKINTCCMLDFQTSSTTLSSAHQAEFFIISRRVVFDFPIHSQSSLATWHWFHTRSEALLLTAVSTEFSISSSSEDNVASAILFTHSPQATPTSFPGLFPSRGRGPPPPPPPTRREKPWERGWGYPNPIIVINYHVHMIPIQRIKIWVLLERCLEC